MLTYRSAFIPLILAVLEIGGFASTQASPAAPPPPPPHVTATPAYQQVTVSWYLSPSATGYNVYRGTKAGHEKSMPIASNLSMAPYVDKRLANGVRYFYTVRAVHGMVMSKPSPEVSAMPAASIDPASYLTTDWPVPDRDDSSGTETLIFQPHHSYDMPPSCLVLMLSSRKGLAVDVNYQAVNNPGARLIAPNIPAPSPSDIPAKHPPPATSQWTPYETNPSLFPDEQHAVTALNSADMMMRRSAVEYLGRWTATDGGGESVDTAAIRKRFAEQTDLIGPLTSAVQEMPKRNSQQAAALLALFGTTATSAIPAVCAALANPVYGDGRPGDGDDFVARATLLSSLVQLCGGPDRLAPTLIGLMNSPQSETRRAAAAALPFCTDPTFLHTYPAPAGAYPMMPLDQEPKWQTQFLSAVIPALAVRVDDKFTVVRVAAAQSLEHLTWMTVPAQWNVALEPLARASASSDPDLRLAALRALAYLPGDLSPVAPALRDALQGDADERSYALAALGHSAQSNRARTLDAFLPQLTSPDLATRRIAADDLQQVAAPLWSGTFFPGPYPLSRWTEDQRLFRISSASDDTARASQTRLLAALVSAVADPDAHVRTAIVSCLEQIGEAVREMSGGGIRRTGFKANPGPTPKSEALDALNQAAASLEKIDPDSAKRLRDLRAEILMPSGMI